jgi:GH25 family lysozyme M1 (1,4-beta-N-acetylmuramidase)
MGNWDNYMLWQFSSSTNCNSRRCPMRIEGTADDIDVNTVPMTRAELATIWSRGQLLPEKPPALQLLVSARAMLGTSIPTWMGARATYQKRMVKPLETAFN